MVRVRPTIRRRGQYGKSVNQDCDHLSLLIFCARNHLMMHCEQWTDWWEKRPQDEATTRMENGWCKREKPRWSTIASNPKSICRRLLLPSFVSFSTWPEWNQNGMSRRILKMCFFYIFFWRRWWWRLTNTGFLKFVDSIARSPMTSIRDYNDSVPTIAFTFIFLSGNFHTRFVTFFFHFRLLAENFSLSTFLSEFVLSRTTRQPSQWQLAA